MADEKPRTSIWERLAAAKVNPGREEQSSTSAPADPRESSAPAPAPAEQADPMPKDLAATLESARLAIEQLGGEELQGFEEDLEKSKGSKAVPEVSPEVPTDIEELRQIVEDAEAHKATLDEALAKLAESIPPEAEDVEPEDAAAFARLTPELQQAVTLRKELKELSRTYVDISLQAQAAVDKPPFPAAAVPQQVAPKAAEPQGQLGAAAEQRANATSAPITNDQTAQSGPQQGSVGVPRRTPSAPLQSTAPSQPPRAPLPAQDAIQPLSPNAPVRQGPTVQGERMTMAEGFRRVEQTSEIQVRLEAELNVSREFINREVLGILDTLIRATDQVIETETAYRYEKGEVKVVRAPDGLEPLLRAAAELEAAGDAVSAFAGIAKDIPQMVAQLDSDFRFFQSRNVAIANGKEPPTERPIVSVPSFEFDAAPRELPRPVAVPGAAQKPESVDTDVAAGVAGGAYKLEAQRPRKIAEQKDRIDLQMITVLNTIEDIQSVAFGFFGDADQAALPEAKSAYRYDRNTKTMSVNVDTWEATRNTVTLLVPIMQRLVEEVQTLIAVSEGTASEVASVGTSSN